MVHRWVCCHPEGPGQAQETGRWEPHEDQQSKMQILHLRKYNPLHQYMLETDQLESSSAEKDLGITVTTS